MLSFLQADTPVKTVLFLRGELVSESAKIFDERVKKVFEETEESGNLLIIDMHEVRFIDSAGIGTLMSVLYNAKAIGRSMRIRRVNPMLKLALSNFLAIEEPFFEEDQQSCEKVSGHWKMATNR